MTRSIPGSTPRRRFIKRSAAAAVALSAGPAYVFSARAQKKSLRILKWKHFVPEFDRWFTQEYTQQWGDANDTEVIVESVGLGDITAIASKQASDKQGHDLVLLLSPASIFERDVIDHREIYEESKSRYGSALESAYRSSYNPLTKKHFAFCTNVIPPVITYRTDLWESVGMRPNSWDDVRRGGRQIKLLHDNPIGISLTPEHNCEHSLRAIMYSFGASVQDEVGGLALKSPQTLDALKYVKALFDEAMPGDVFNWNAVSNNQYMLSSNGCLTLDTLSIIRTAESKRMPVGNNLGIAELPEGPAGRLGPAFGVDNFIIWKFAQNQSSAKQFLVDYIGHSRDALLTSGFQHMPSFPGAVPDLDALLTTDASAANPGQYSLLTQLDKWTTNLGYPGYSNPAVGEVLTSNLMAKMFSQVAMGALTPDQSMTQAAQEARSIFAKTNT